MSKGFLPISKDDMQKLGWDYIDFLLVTGDAYVDHPSFGHAIIARVLESGGYRVGILAQPSWDDEKDFYRFGKPRLGVMVSGGVIDSMVNHYTAGKKPRSCDSYSPGGKAGMRPDRCVIVYCNLIRKAFGDIPIIIGGIEASLRRFAHYDYWSNKVRRSIIFDSRADMISYGMGENQTLEIAQCLEKGYLKDNIPGTCIVSDKVRKDAIELPSFEEVSSDKKAYARAALIEYEEQDPIRGKVLCQKHGNKYLVQNIPAMPLTRSQLDRVYSLPYMRNYHPSYEALGGVPALEEVKFSIASSRGCFGSCSFCALTMHQGRIVQSRSEASILAEAKKLIYEPDFKGYIHDVGGPTANFRVPACEKQLKEGTCKHRECLFPAPCKNLKVDHSEYLSVLKKLRELPGIKKVFIRSGIRYDYLIYDKDDSFFNELCAHHVSGQLKVAPEHVSDNVLQLMGKPSRQVYEKFKDKFYEINNRIGKEQYLVPYLMSSHPGSTLNDAIELSCYLKKNKLRPQQVQDFYPTPGTLSTAMFYTGLDPKTMKEVYVAKTYEEKDMQRALLQSSKPENYNIVKKALIKAGREDLIGNGENCLIRNKSEGRQFYDDIRRKKGIPENKGRGRKRSPGPERERDKTRPGRNSGRK
ncbi:MAG: YgiQ family radical SAM protein [Bacillota bacterium]|nr:YgiQ family radical SAM protein [Bacillota bacterium]